MWHYTANLNKQVFTSLCQVVFHYSWKLLIFVSFETKDLQILMFKHTFISQECFEWLIEQIHNAYSRVKRDKGWTRFYYNEIRDKGLKHRPNIETTLVNPYSAGIDISL